MDGSQMPTPMPPTDGLTPRQRFDRRRRRVNWGVLGLLVLFCGVFYAVAMVKLAHYGLSWME